MSDPRDVIQHPGSLAAPDDILPAGAYEPEVLPAGLTRAPVGVNSLATEHLIVNMGPQHPSTHGVLRVLIELDGEKVVSGEAVVGYLHRGIEKLAESRRYSAVATLMDRGDYVSGILARQRSLWQPRSSSTLRFPAAQLAALADVGAQPHREPSRVVRPHRTRRWRDGTVPLRMRDREVLLDILEDVTGQRMMFNYVRPGGVLADITPTAETKIRYSSRPSTCISKSTPRFWWERDFQARTRGVGVIDRERALAFSLSGANLRATGSSCDVRKDRPYAAYSELDFDIPIAEEGDSTLASSCGWKRCVSPCAWFVNVSMDFPKASSRPRCQRCCVPPRARRTQPSSHLAANLACT